MKSEAIILKKVRFIPQGKNSANCGPCGLKMIADYYGVRHPRHKGPISLHSYNRLLKTTSEWGTEQRDIHRLAKKLGLRPQRVPYKNLRSLIKKGHPILSLFIDESGIGHYAPIVGLDRTKLIFQDSYWGKRYVRERKSFRKMSAYFKHWFYAYLPINP